MSLRRALILAPHPDDEVLGCATVLRRRRSVIAHVTDGVVDGHGGAAAAARAALRRAESAAAAEVLGAEVAQSVSLGFADQDVWRRVDDLAEATAGLVRALEPDDVYVPGYQNGHPDHDGTYVAARLARAREDSGARWWVYGLYGLDDAGRRRFDHLDPLLFEGAWREPGGRASKARALRCFASQTGPGRVLEHWLSAPADEVFAPMPPSGRLPALPCYYEAAFPDRCRVGADVVREHLQRCLDAADAGSSRPSRASGV